MFKKSSTSGTESLHLWAYSSRVSLTSLRIKPGNNNVIHGGENDKRQITLMQVIIRAAEFSQVSAAQLSALWEGIYSIMLTDI